MEKYQIKPTMKFIDENAELQRLFNKLEDDMIFFLQEIFKYRFNAPHNTTVALPIIELEFQKQSEKAKLRCQIAYAEFT